MYVILWVLSPMLSVLTRKYPNSSLLKFKEWVYIQFYIQSFDYRSNVEAIRIISVTCQRNLLYIPTRIHIFKKISRYESCINCTLYSTFKYTLYYKIYYCSLLDVALKPYFTNTISVHFTYLVFSCVSLSQLPLAVWECIPGYQLLSWREFYLLCFLFYIIIPVLLEVT